MPREWLIEARKKKHMTQKAVSDAVGVKPPTYWSYERGNINPTPAKAQRIAAVLGFDWTAFYQDKPAH